tara:strand:- start:285 stop:440 length:156 start_codon:yes stop_codon:yes gene_type:complete
VTVDSKYLGPVTFENDGETEYPFEIESVGAEAFKIFLVDENDSSTQLKQQP